MSVGIALLLAAATPSSASLPAGPALAAVIADRDDEFFRIFFSGCAPERLAGRAAFTQLWVLDAGVWKLSRVLSHAHEAAR